MYSKFIKYIIDNQLFTHSDKLLLAVSGGADSMVLLHLLHRGGYRIEVAHCNFQLRGGESDGDEILVKEVCSDKNIPFHSKRFDTEGYSKSHKISIQEAARTLRYIWFEELRQSIDFQRIITAHNASDSVETFLFNIARGAGLAGLKGIPLVNGYIVRPLLWANKEEVRGFAQSENIEFRNDSSNFSDKYSRNFIRYQIVPSFKKLNPDFENTILENIKHFKESNDLLNLFLENIKKDIVQNVDNQILIDIIKLKTYPSVSTILFDILKEYNFHPHQIPQILKENDVKTKTGVHYYSSTHELLVDRENFIVRKKENADIEKKYLIYEADNELVIEHLILNFEKIQDTNIEIIKNNKNVAQLDFDKLVFPLTLRHWQEGDKFQPLGMGGKTQKLSDFFAHHKLSNFDKEKIWVLENGNKTICWVVGWRVDEGYKIFEKTTNCFKIIIA